MQNANEVIDHLAAKLSVPAAHLWAVLVRQAQAEAIADAILVGLYIIFAIVVALKARRFLTWLSETDSDTVSEVVGSFGVIVGGIVLIIGFVMSVVLSYELVLYTINPEYYAVAKILSALK